MSNYTVKYTNSIMYLYLFWLPLILRQDGYSRQQIFCLRTFVNMLLNCIIKIIKRAIKNTDPTTTNIAIIAHNRRYMGLF